MTAGVSGEIPTVMENPVCQVLAPGKSGFAVNEDFRDGVEMQKGSEKNGLHNSNFSMGGYFFKMVLAALRPGMPLTPPPPCRPLPHR